MSLLKYIAGLVLILGAPAAIPGASLVTLIDAASVVIVFGGTLGMLLLGGSDIPGMFRAVRSKTADGEDAVARLTDWKMARIYSLFAGCVGAAGGFLIMLTNMDKPEAIGPGMAMCLLSCLYAQLLAFGLCLPMQGRLQSRAQTHEDRSVLPSAVISAVVMSLLCTVPFPLLLIDFGGS